MAFDALCTHFDALFTWRLSHILLFQVHSFQVPGLNAVYFFLDVNLSNIITTPVCFVLAHLQIWNVGLRKFMPATASE